MESLVRVTDRQRFEKMQSHISDSQKNNVEALERLSSQKKINKIADDPVRMTHSIKNKTILKNLVSLRDNIFFSKGYLDMAESALSSIAQSLSRARELAIYMSNDTVSPDERKITAKEVQEIGNEVIELGNTRFLGRYIFSGFKSNTPTLDSNGNFQGDDGKIFLQMGIGDYNRINISGPDLFVVSQEEKDKGHSGLSVVLRFFRDALENNDKEGIFAALDELSYQINKVANAQASLGARYGSIEQALLRVEDQINEHTEEVSRLEDADIFEATSDYKRAETSLENTLAASSSFLHPTLLDFIGNA